MQKYASKGIYKQFNCLKSFKKLEIPVGTFSRKMSASPDTPSSVGNVKRAVSPATVEGPSRKIHFSEFEETLRVKKLVPHAVLPKRGSAGAAGYDLASSEDWVVPARGKAIVPTGISIVVPPGTYGRVAPRSGLAVKNFIDTGAGVIDEDYRGPVGVVLFNHSEQDFIVKRGDRVAQLVIERISTPEVVEVNELDDTTRGAGGYGSTGV